MPLTTEQQSIVDYVVSLPANATSKESTIMVNSVAGIYFMFNFWYYRI